MFYLSGTINHKYLKNEVRVSLMYSLDPHGAHKPQPLNPNHPPPPFQIRNITLYVSRLKFRPLTWRNTHPYVLVDRFEDVTPPEKLQAAPNVRCWSFLRYAHIVGVG